MLIIKYNKTVVLRKKDNVMMKNNEIVKINCKSELKSNKMVKLNYKRVKSNVMMIKSNKIVKISFKRKERKIMT